ncbi:MAG: TrkA family potassium uptake protein [Oscillospiraceae bacterium]|nr:TrkA family potassium uptake protein [Oscillospiraceae bacterium]
MKTKKSVLIIGLGRFGRHAALKMMELRHQVMAVDKDESRVNALARLVTNAQIGDSTDEEFLRSLGVRDFDVCIVAIGDDFQSSLETTSLLKELGARHVVARASRERHEKFLLRNGADEVVYPEKQVAEWTAISAMSEQILDYFTISEGYSVFELSVPAEWAGHTMAELDVRKRYGVNVLGIKDKGVFNMSITPDTVFAGGASVLVLGRDRDVMNYFPIK